jgi:hypothetical protein
MATNKKMGILFWIFILLLSFGFSENFGFHITSAGVGYNASLGFTVLDKVELQAGCIVNDTYSSFAKEYIGYFGTLPYLGAKYTIYESPSKQVRAYIHGQYGKGNKKVKTSDESLLNDAEYYGSSEIMPDNFLYSYDLTTEFFQIGFGSEYFLDSSKGFSLSGELVYKSTIDTFNYKGNPIKGVEDVVKGSSGTQAQVGLNYYFQ